ADIIVLSDYAKGCLQPSVIAKVVKSAKAAGKMVIADPKLADFAAYADVDVLTPNLAELQSATQSELSNIDDIARISAQLAKEHRIGAIMATLSARGVLLASASGDTTHIPAMARDVFDVSGAGDTVVATFSASIAAGVDFATAASIANLAASIVVEKSGTAVVSPGEIIARLATAMPPTD
ncbi:MAG: PfkB family carbohydrate kinase, partial [Alphaproteobacteria bacterium]